MIKKGMFFWVIGLIIISTSCSKYNQLLKSTDNELKYETAIDFYEQGNYYRASQLFDQLKTIYRGTEKDERIQYYIAYTNYKQGDYVIASYYFKKFAKGFPYSEFSEECMYMSAYCYYLDSPKYSLDQTNTIEAMKELQLFMDLYPKSERIDECNKLIDSLRDKLELKAYEIAMLYFKIEDYQAAVVSFENVLDNFPDTDYREEIYFYILKSRYIYADKSIESKKHERFELAVKSYDKLASNYPNSAFLKEANTIKESSKKYLN